MISKWLVITSEKQAATILPEKENNNGGFLITGQKTNNGNSLTVDT